jgi:Ca2+-binding RTX toxin-like protein
VEPICSRAHTARGQEIGTDHLSGFEKAFGGEGNDTIFGSGAANFLGGGGGNDRLSGLDGDDTLGGGKGLDVLRGGLGKDQLTGGADADHFVFETLADSVVGVNRDVVIDFSHGQFDIIDVHLIDADPNLNGDQSFQFIGAGAFSHAAGELRYAGHVLSGDVDGDGIADFSLHVNAASLLAADFVL